MNDRIKVKIGSALLFISIVLAFGVSLRKSEKLAEPQKDFRLNSKKLKDDISSTGGEKPNSMAAVMSPTPFVKQKGQVKGETSVVRFEKDLETSLPIQEAPQIWLEFMDDENRIVKVELPKRAREYIRQRWLSFFKFSYQMRSAKNREEKREIETQSLTNTVFLATELDDLQIKTPVETRKISEDEAFEIIILTAKFAFARYEELQNMETQITTQNPY